MKSILGPILNRREPRVSPLFTLANASGSKEVNVGSLCSPNCLPHFGDNEVDQIDIFIFVILE